MNFIRDRRKMSFIVFAASFVLMISAATYIFLQQIWFEPIRVYTEAQSRCEILYEEQEWTGYPAWYHYENRVRFICPELNDENVSLLYPIIHSVEGLQSIELHATSLSQEGVAAMKGEFPNCDFRVKDS